MKVKIKRLDKTIEVPKYVHEGDAGFDIRSGEDVLIKAGEKVIISTKLSMSVPEGYVGLIWDRSGLAARNSLHCLSGVLDSGYRGEIKVIMVNLSEEDFHIEKGMRIAQMLIQPCIRARLEEVDTLSETKRGDGRFGSTGFH